MTLPKIAALIAKYRSCSQSFFYTLTQLTTAFFQAKQRAWKKYDIFARAAWTDSCEDLTINALI